MAFSVAARSPEGIGDAAKLHVKRVSVSCHHDEGMVLDCLWVKGGWLGSGRPAKAGRLGEDGVQHTMVPGMDRGYGGFISIIAQMSMFGHSVLSAYFRMSSEDL